MSTVENMLNFLCENLDYKIVTDLYIKTTDRHQYTHYTLSLHYHNKRSIICSHALQVRRIYSFENDFIRHQNEMKSWFLKREYPKTLIDMGVKFLNTTGNK